MISSLQKLTDRPSDGMGSTGRESGRGWPISRGRSGRYSFVFSFHVNLMMMMLCEDDSDWLYT
ncbi:unnamed protein product [Brassica oleracea var. botrytis]